VPELLISAAVSIGLAILAFVLGRLNLKAHTALERNEDLARRALELARSMASVPDRSELNDVSNQVHAAVDTFSRGVAGSVLEPAQKPLAPAR
jgi:hypothetical protein